MRMRVDAAGDDVSIGGIDRLIPFEVLTDLDDLLTIDQDVRLPLTVGGDDGSVLDDFGHWFGLLECDMPRT